MSVTVSYGSLVSFLDDHVDRPATEPTTQTTGLCLVAGGIVGSNLEDELERQAIPTERLAITTIENTAKTLLDSHHRREGLDDLSVDLLDSQLCQTLLVDIITTAPESTGLETVDELLTGFEWSSRPALRETLWSELDRYFRMTDAGRDHDAACGIARELAEDDPYAAERSLRALDAFDELHSALTNRTEPLAETAYLSRSHLVGAARQRLAAEWVRCYPDVEWVAVDTVAVLDNPTLRFFETLGSLDEGPEIYVFGTEAGPGPTLYDRLAATSLEPLRAEAESVDAPHVDALMNTVDGEPPNSIPDTQFIEAPDARRELAAVATRIRELTGLADSEATTTCGEIVVAAKDVIPYRSRIETVFRAHGVPTHIQARRPLMQTVPYRYLTAVCKLLAAAETNQPVTRYEFLDPLRLGFCLPESLASTEPATSVEWPLDGEQVAELEAWLETLVDERAAEDGQPLVVWAETIRANSEPREQAAVYALINWIESTKPAVPDSAEAVVDQLTALLDAHGASLASEGVRRASGPGIDDTRIALTAAHDTYVVDRLRRALDRVGTYLQQAVATGVAGYCWQDITGAVRQVCGGASYWPQSVDGNAVRVVNAANAHYLDVDYTFVIGLGAGEFPAERTPPTLFHEAFYEAIRADNSAASTDSARGYLHAPTADSQFDGDIEEYRAAVSAADQGVWLCRQYTDREGDPVPWSGFVDAYTATAGDDADDIHRIAVDAWLPTGHDDQEAMVRAAIPRDRLGLLCGTFPDGIAQTTRTQQSTAGLSDRAAIVELLSAADGEAYRQEIEPRRRRYAGEDIRSITVEPDESIQQDGNGTPTSRSTEAVAGPPTRTHELDLYANCQLKYYVRQYVDGAGRRRDEPRDGAESEMPRLLRERYPKPAFRAGLRRLITTVLADRQAAFGQFDSVTAFRDQLAAWIADDPALDGSLMQPMIGEYQAVQQELDAGIAREWRWEPAQTVRIDGHELRLSGHRVDSMTDHPLDVPVLYTAEAGAAARIVDRSLADRSAVTERDHRLLAGAAAVETFGGALVYDPTSASPSVPDGVVVGDLNPIPNIVVDSTNLIQLGRAQWTDRQELWAESAATALSDMTYTDDPLTYRSSESFVENDGCAGCAYRELCGVPASHRRDR